jgi:hypothetical protein
MKRALPSFGAAVLFVAALGTVMAPAAQAPPAHAQPGVTHR